MKDDNEIIEEFNKSVVIGREAFELMVEHSGGRAGMIIIAVSSIIASMEAQQPGIRSDIDALTEVLVTRAKTSLKTMLASAQRLN